MGTDSDEVTTGLAELQSLGLARPSGADAWQALPLLDAVHALKSQRVAEIEAATAAAESMQSRILAASRTQPADNITVLIGTEAIVEARDSICDDAVKEICAFDKPPYVQARPNASPQNLSESSPEWRALERGLSLRCVYHPGFDADRLAELALFADKGEKSRTAPVPMKLILADAEVALIPSMRSYEPGQELRASVVRHPQLVEALVWLFESVFEQSVPIITSAGYNASDPRRQMLISLLMAGSTDNAIASQLGINVRSVRRWIADLMDELGVATRLQLGAALVRSDSLRSKPQSR
jgi:DNA-binding CsgD family transcriptional regulator